MSEDFLNGLSVVPLDDKTTKQWIKSATDSPAEHPWRGDYQKRDEPPSEAKTPPETYYPPTYYSKSVRAPQHKYHSKASYQRNGRWVTREVTKVFAHEIIRLRDVEAFRAATSKKAACIPANHNQVGALSGRLSGLSISSSPIRPVIYRYIDVIKNSMALLEAIHFELFMPDRPDLRFLGGSCADVPTGTVEGDYFRVLDADLLSASSFAVKLGKHNYPVVWEAKGIQKMVFDGGDRNKQESGLTYILKKNANTPGVVKGINAISEQDIPIREMLFPDADSRREHSLVRVTSIEMATAQLYAVEPPKKKEKEGMGADRKGDDKKKGKNEKNYKKKKGKEDAARDGEKPFDPRSEYLKRVCNVKTSSQRSGRVVTAVRELSATEAERIEDRLGAFTKYGQSGDLRLMDELFRLGSRYRESASRGEDSKDAGEMKIDESVILKTLMDNALVGSLSTCRPILDCIYGRGCSGNEEARGAEVLHQVGGMTLNAAQSRALRLYTDSRGPRVFCILSPPGSGKTTVAAAMAAEVARCKEKPSAMPHLFSQLLGGLVGGGGLQLLLSVQNVAVDNIGAALKKMDYGGGQVYNMKSTRKLDLDCPAPFDFLDLMQPSKLEEWRTGEMSLERRVITNREALNRDKRKGKKHRTEPTFERKLLSEEECLTIDRREFEQGIEPKIILATVEMVLQKIYTSGNLRVFLGAVTRVIIDEASLLTEAALFGIIRRFPEARIVLIGDDHQLPPFMYDGKILGHELAGRPALTVAMKTGRVPVVELNEVYRAPPSLVAPYNRLAYGGKLVSKKAEGETPLSEVGLIHPGLPQLLLIDVDGHQERNEKTKSLYNEKEIKALQRLLSKFPKDWKDEIMIICLYKEQKNRLSFFFDYTILTVDSAQGKEKPIVILMTTRTEIPKQGTFFDSTERCNVAVSRQQKALIILGKASLLTTNKPWSTVVNGDDFTRIKAEDIK